MVLYEAGLKARDVAVFAGSWALSWIMICYAISGLKGHTPWWLPMISDCAVGSPEKYFFRFGLISAAVFLNLNSALMLLYHKCGFASGAKMTDRFCLFLATVACIALALVGSINEDENGSVHGACAVVFFFGYQAYMWIILHRLRPSTGFASSFSWKVKLLLASVSQLALIILVKDSAHWGANHIQIAVCEWLSVICIILFNGSLSFEYGDSLYVAAVLCGQQPSPTSSSSLSFQGPSVNPEEYAHLLSHDASFAAQPPAAAYPQLSVNYPSIDASVAFASAPAYSAVQQQQHRQNQRVQQQQQQQQYAPQQRPAYPSMNRGPVSQPSHPVQQQAFRQPSPAFYNAEQQQQMYPY